LRVSAKPAWSRLGENAFRAPLPDGCDPTALLAALRAAPGVRDAVVTDGFAAVYGVASPPPLEVATEVAAPREHVIRLRYDGADLDELAARTRLDRSEIAARHAAPRYRVAFLGFLPGFGYLDGLDPLLVVPRRASPRARVPAGAVGIAARYTAVYPFSSPGGWTLIGTAVDFAPWSDEGPLLAAGDGVRFVVA
jgi:UPF0271 protein